MSKTTRELAELFGVSKQAVEKKYTPEFKAKYMSKVTINGVPTWLISDEGVNALRAPVNHSYLRYRLEVGELRAVRLNERK